MDRFCGLVSGGCLVLYAAVLTADPLPVAQDADAATTLPPLVVVATKTERLVTDVAGSVSVVDAHQLSRQLSIEMMDIVRYTPGVALPRPTTRFGWGSYSVRGVGGNRVAIELDGIPIANQFEIGNYSNAGRDVVDVDLLQRVEVLYGPASTLYGSDALGGVVAYYTHDPEQLAAAGDPHLSAVAGFRGDQHAMNTRLTGSWQVGRLGSLLSLGQRRGEHREASAQDASTPVDSQRWDSSSVFAKLAWQPGANSRLTTTLEQADHDSDTDIRSILGSGRFGSTTLLRGDDRQSRRRASLRYQFEYPRHEGRVIAYYQGTQTRQDSIEERASQDIRRSRSFEFDQRSSGAELNVSSQLDGIAGIHKLSYGIEIGQTRTRELRDGWQTTLAGGNYSNTLLGEAFPVRDFPVSRGTELGLYLQDEIRFGDLTLIPALRYDHYDLQPRPDTIYLDDNPDSDIVSIRTGTLSPRFGAVYALKNRWSIFAQYAQGFRAPPFSDANIGLDIPLFNIRAIANPDLRAETSKGIEVGVRRVAASDEFSLAGFYTDYDNFIESRAPLGPEPGSGVLLFQSRNLGKAVIYGAELRFRQRLNKMLGMWGALAWTRGEDQLSGEPINTIDPAELVLGLDWRPAALPLSGQVIWTLVDRQDRYSDPDGHLGASAGFGVVDVTAAYESSGVTLRAGVFNVFDQTHWRWASVRGVPADDPTRPLLSEPGRYAGVTLSLEW